VVEKGFKFIDPQAVL